MGRLALAAALCLAPVAGLADDEPEIDMEGDAPKDPPAEPASVKDPKLAAKWLQTAKMLVAKAEAAARAKKPDEAKVQFENAITAYEKAIEHGTDVNLVFELASVEEKAGRLDRAATHFRAYVKLQPARADLVRRAQARYDELTTKTGLVTIVTRPEEATISLGDRVIAATPLVDPLVLMPGTYTFVIAADGHVQKTVDFEVEAGSESERTIELERGVDKPVVKPVIRVEPTPEEPVDTGLAAPSRLPLYVGAGATGGLLVIATITGVVALGKHGTFEDDTASPADRADAKDSGKRLALVTDLCLVGAIAAGGFTAYWYFAKYRPAQRKMGDEKAKAAVVPWVKPDAGGLALAGSF